MATPDQGPGVTRLIVTPDVAGLRLDQAIAGLCGLSRRQVRAVIAAGGVWLNARPSRVLSRPVVVADVIDVLGQNAPPTPAAAPLPRLRILFDDGWLLAVDKPAGLACQPPRQRAPGEWTVHELAAARLAARDGRRGELLLIHRLDRVTTGVLIFARQHDAARALATAWGSGTVRKRYLAIVAGDPGEEPRVVAAPLGADRLVPGRQRVAKSGRDACSEIIPLARGGALGLVEIRPLTGRTHQVRVHLAHLGCPVAGDTLYGGGSPPGKDPSVARPFLHAWRIDLPHPRTGRTISIAAPLPPDMVVALATAGIDVEATLRRAAT